MFSLQNAGSHINDPKKVYPFVKLGQQCMDRVATIVEKLYGKLSSCQVIFSCDNVLLIKTNKKKVPVINILFKRNKLHNTYFD